MMDRIRLIWKKHREALSYLVFGVLTTAVNFVLFMALTAWTGLSTGAANAIAISASVLFAYVTNKIWVFESRLTGWAAVKEFGRFIACRIATALLDQLVVVAGVDWVGSAMGLADSWVWTGAVKVFASALVIISNYIFSKLLIFNK